MTKRSGWSALHRFKSVSSEGGTLVTVVGPNPSS